MKSAYLSNRSIKALNRLGDIIVPKKDDFPSFSEYGGVEHIDKLVALAPSADIEDLNTLLLVLSFMPTFVLKLIIVMCTGAGKSNLPLSPLLRQLNVAIRGLVFSCYYSERPGASYKGKDPAEIIGYEINRVID